MRAETYAKVNLALAVYPPMADGYHPIRGIFQTIRIADVVEVSPASEDAISVSNDEAPSDDTNLAWQAVAAVRRASRTAQPTAVAITKAIPSGSGLGGGSADAAAALGLAGLRFSVGADELEEIATDLGSDVPFALRGGTCLVEGVGERLTEMPPLDDFGVAVVVPPFSMSTPAVYREWDRLDGPIGDTLDDRSLPPSLRDGLPIRNDLFPAARSLDGRIGDWHADLRQRWATDVAMTGSGSAFFAFFGSVEEADDAARSVDLPVRLAVGVSPSPVGWKLLDE